MPRRNPVDGGPGDVAMIVRRHGNILTCAAMVVVAQLVEHRVVVPGVAGSSPVDHPIVSEQQARSSDRA